MAPALLFAACATTDVETPFSATGPVWPPSPQQARVAFIGQFSDESDLGIVPSFWERVVALTAGEADTSLSRPMAVAATSDGQVIFVADPEAGCVHRYDLRKGRYDCLAAEESAAEVRAVGLTVMADQWLIVADSQAGQLYRAEIDDKFLSAFYVSADLEQPTGVFWSSATERLFITDTARQSVLELDSLGNLKRVIGGRGSAPGQFNFPTYLWVDDRDELLVTDSLNFRLQRFDVDGRFLSTFGENGDLPGDFSRPKGVATDQYGHIYVIDAMMHAIQIFDRDGRLLLSIGEQGQGVGEFWLPNGIFVTNGNMIFVADAYNRRVQVFRYVGPPS
jgi:sugar lactone lactonase YvrE